jgi:hypothetical protein
MVVIASALAGVRLLNGLFLRLIEVRSEPLAGWKQLTGMYSGSDCPKFQAAFLARAPGGVVRVFARCLSAAKVRWLVHAA